MGGEVKILIVLPRFEAHLPLERRSFGYFPSLLKESNVRRKVMLIFLGGGSCGGSRLGDVRGGLMLCKNNLHAT